MTNIMTIDMGAALWFEPVLGGIDIHVLIHEDCPADIAKFVADAAEAIKFAINSANQGELL